MGICIPSRDRLPPFQGRAGERLQISREIIMISRGKGKENLCLIQEATWTYVAFVGFHVGFVGFHVGLIVP